MLMGSMMGDKDGFGCLGGLGLPGGADAWSALAPCGPLKAGRDSLSCSPRSRGRRGAGRSCG